MNTQKEKEEQKAADRMKRRLAQFQQMEKMIFGKEDETRQNILDAEIQTSVNFPEASQQLFLMHQLVVARQSQKKERTQIEWKQRLHFFSYFCVEKIERTILLERDLEFSKFVKEFTLTKWSIEKLALMREWVETIEVEVVEAENKDFDVFWRQHQVGLFRAKQKQERREIVQEGIQNSNNIISEEKTLFKQILADEKKDFQEAWAAQCRRERGALEEQLLSTRAIYAEDVERKRLTLFSSASSEEVLEPTSRRFLHQHFKQIFEWHFSDLFSILKDEADAKRKHLVNDWFKEERKKIVGFWNEKIQATKEKEAAMLIQRIFRGHSGKQKAKRKRRELEEFARAAKRAAASIQCQRLLRARNSEHRRYHKECEVLAKNVQPIGRGEKIRVWIQQAIHIRKKNALLLIQRCGQSFFEREALFETWDVAMKKLQVVKVEKDTAAMKIQWAYNAHVAKKKAKQMACDAQHRRMQGSASVAIQCLIRRRHARKVLLERAAQKRQFQCVLLQRVIRAGNIRLAIKAQYDTRIIQCFLRGKISLVALFSKSRDAPVCVMQRAARVMLANRKVVREEAARKRAIQTRIKHNAVIQIQRIFRGWASRHAADLAVGAKRRARYNEVAEATNYFLDHFQVLGRALLARKKVGVLFIERYLRVRCIQTQCRANFSASQIVQQKAKAVMDRLGQELYLQRVTLVQSISRSWLANQLSTQLHFDLKDRECKFLQAVLFAQIISRSYLTRKELHCQFQKRRSAMFLIAKRVVKGVEVRRQMYQLKVQARRDMEESVGRQSATFLQQWWRGTQYRRHCAAFTVQIQFLKAKKRLQLLRQQKIMKAHLMGLAQKEKIRNEYTRRRIIVQDEENERKDLFRSMPKWMQYPPHRRIAILLPDELLQQQKRERNAIQFDVIEGFKQFRETERKQREIIWKKETTLHFEKEFSSVSNGEIVNRARLGKAELRFRREIRLWLIDRVGEYYKSLCLDLENKEQQERRDNILCVVEDWIEQTFQQVKQLRQLAEAFRSPPSEIEAARRKAREEREEEAEKEAAKKLKEEEVGKGSRHEPPPVEESKTKHQQRRPLKMLPSRVIQHLKLFSKTDGADDFEVLDDVGVEKLLTVCSSPDTTPEKNKKSATTFPTTKNQKTEVPEKDSDGKVEKMHPVVPKTAAAEGRSLTAVEHLQWMEANDEGVVDCSTSTLTHNQHRLLHHASGASHPGGGTHSSLISADDSWVPEICEKCKSMSILLTLNFTGSALTSQGIRKIFEEMLVKKYPIEVINFTKCAEVNDIAALHMARYIDKLPTLKDIIVTGTGISVPKRQLLAYLLKEKWAEEGERREGATTKQQRNFVAESSEVPSSADDGVKEVEKKNPEKMTGMEKIMKKKFVTTNTSTPVMSLQERMSSTLLTWKPRPLMYPRHSNYSTTLSRPPIRPEEFLKPRKGKEQEKPEE